MSISTVELKNNSWFKIPDYDLQRPFFMSLVSDSNHWMFISSNGGLSAGRKNPQFALFPYYTDDKISELAPTTGSKTIFQVKIDGKIVVWEPFIERFASNYSLSRNLYKNSFGNKIMFEEINHDLGLTFRYEWNSSNKYGFVKHSTLINNASNVQSIKLLDGLQNIMPYGVSSDLQTRASNLVDAYKRSELVPETGLGIFALSAIIVDKAEPSEALKANVVWSFGLQKPSYLLSSLQLNQFREKKALVQETDIKGEKGAYFVSTDVEIEAESTLSWTMVANVNLDHAQVIALNHSMEDKSKLSDLISDDVELGTQKLIALIAGADGLQRTSDQIKDARHYSNVLFNIMRGGTFDYNYQIEKRDFVAYLSKASIQVYQRNESFLAGLNEHFDKTALDEWLQHVNDADLKRLGKEYLPLKFSRRHGDPSRPWNQFSINTHSEVDGSKILDYEGNWRDIFQNWEALAYSYPAFLESMIFKFLNATTFDGYNPYRVTKGGFDWETIEPDDPWSYIGYWGDHQIIYLLKLLEAHYKFQPTSFNKLFTDDVFVYANVPYRIKSYKDITKNPKDTIEFDEASDHAIREKVARIGADGALLSNGTDPIHHVNFVEKILATVLAKISNFIPEAGIWMNTQRPEWNDANNALVGNGVSMVTLYYLRRFLTFFKPLISSTESKQILVSEELSAFFNQLNKVLSAHKALLTQNISDLDRKTITDGLGQAGSDFRDKIYDHGFSGNRVVLDLHEVIDFLTISTQYLEHAIRANKRQDNLYHAYNLMSMDEKGVSISYLDEMLEGQVAVLSSGYLDEQEALQVLDSLRKSALYREDQNSYILYPNKNLPGFLQKNVIPEKLVKTSSLLQTLVEENNTQIISKDILGGYHFNGEIKNAGDLKAALSKLSAEDFGSLVQKEEALILQLFEEVFNHKAFTGRSGTFFGYEGLGSIYWHMVSKLYLAAFEVCSQAVQNQTDENTFHKLMAHFDEIGAGIGMHKSPELYGAFPTDPYSHTPQHRGAQQPGMTGQVKEDILVRFGELGMLVEEGTIRFSASLLKKAEFNTEAQNFNTISVNQEAREINLGKNALGFTFCQVPVIYKIAEQERIEILYTNGKVHSIDSLRLDEATAQELFMRTGKVSQLSVYLKQNQLR